MTEANRDTPLEASAGAHHWRVETRRPAQPRASLLWLPALGVAARHYLPFADALAARGIAVYLHEWRGNGSSTLRADRRHDWGYRELLMEDIPASVEAIRATEGAAPAIIGGHSLGGQLACCRLALQSLQGADEQEIPRRLWLVASGAPYWRAFPPPTRYALPLAYRFLPWLAQRCGALPGRRIGFGGDEARGLIRDWARTALSGRYAAEGVPFDLEAGMARLEVEVAAIVFRDDWLAPRSSLAFLLGKMPAAKSRVVEFDAPAPGISADHFAWMKQPTAVAGALADQDPGADAAR